MTTWRNANSDTMRVFTYDYDIQGGATTSTIDLGDLPEDFVIESATVEILDEVVGSGDSVIIGNAADDNGYVNAVICSGSSHAVYKCDGALIFSTPSSKPYKVEAANVAVTMAINNAVVTAGKFVLRFFGYQGEHNE